MGDEDCKYFSTELCGGTHVKNTGGVLGGITTGQELVCRFVVKPTSSIISTKKTINTKMQETTISTKGRHDPCVGIRAVPVGEAMIATTLADHCLRFL